MQQVSICRCRPKQSEEGRGEGKSGDRNLIKERERREEEGHKKKEQVIVEQDAEQRAGGVLDTSEDLKPVRSEGVG